MTIRTRLSLWYAAVMFVALMIMGVLLYYQIIIGPREHARKHPERHHTEQAINQDIFEDVTGIVMWCAVPAVLLSIGGGWWLMKKSLAPVASLTQATKKISAYNLSERLPRAGNGDELDRLTEVFNGMLARLEDSFNRTREFTLHASHELKTPLTILCGETETALRDESLSAAERERAASLLDELRRLARIVDGLTLLSKADAGQVALKLEPVRLDELVRDNFADAQILAEPQGIQVELAACEEITVRGDRHRLRQLLLNLADNAVKYNQPQGQVTVALRRAGDSAEFTITNTGPGIPSEILPRVFDRFYRGDAAHSNVVDGCGLGLSIVQWIVSAHHGTIKIESVPSKITTVTIRLPLAQEGKPGVSAS
jgi:heavy metal sensor kinase